MSTLQVVRILSGLPKLTYISAVWGRTNRSYITYLYISLPNKLYTGGWNRIIFQAHTLLDPTHTKPRTETVREEVILANEGISLKDNSVSPCIWQSGQKREKKSTFIKTLLEPVLRQCSIYNFDEKSFFIGHAFCLKKSYFF